MNFKLKKLVVYSLIMSILLCLPVYAADEEEDIMVIDYEDIVDMVLENNLNLEMFFNLLKLILFYFFGQLLTLKKHYNRLFQ